MQAVVLIRAPQDVGEVVKCGTFLRNLKMASKILYLGSFEIYTPRENNIMNLHVSSFKDDQHPHSSFICIP